jgi:hypothetical protein
MTMDEKDLANYLDHQRWLINNGLLNPIVQDNLFMYGTLAHPDLKELDVSVDVLNKHINYILFFDTKMISAINKFNDLILKKNFWGILRLWFFLKRHGNLDFKSPLQRMVSDYCGAKWTIDVQVKHVSEYQREFKQEWTQTTKE